jgi:hypothetical protein
MPIQSAPTMPHQVAPIYSMPPPPPPMSSEDMDVEKEHDVVIKNITISRDATSGSGFEQEKLMALRESAIKAGPSSRSPMPPPPPDPPAGWPQNQPPPQMMPGMMPPPPPAMNSMLGHPPPPPQPYIPYNPNGSSLPPSHRKKEKSSKSSRMMDSFANSSKKRSIEDDDAYSRLSQRIRALEEENDELKAAQGIEKKPPRYQVFHTISDDPKTYLEPPTWELASDDEWRLRGHLPVSSKARFLQTRRDIVFSVEKTYSSDPLDEEVKKLILQGGEVPEAKARKEKIVLETTEMTQALMEFVQQNPSLEEEFDDLSNITELRAPYLFWYGCRSPTALDNLEPRHHELMKLVVDFIEEGYLAEWQKADTMFESGYVSLTTMPYLVKPGEVIVTIDEGQVFGLVAYSWAYTRAQRPLRDMWQRYLEKTETAIPKSLWSVNGWAYNFDGEIYKKGQSCELSLSVRTEDEEVKMSELNFYPLRFATQEVREKLELRGKTYWTLCRSQKLVSYQEDDSENLRGVSTALKLEITWLTMNRLESELCLTIKLTRSSTTNRPFDLWDGITSHRPSVMRNFRKLLIFTYSLSR